MRGLFISLDGIDGCGKSTQIQLLAEWFQSQQHQVVTVRDPGGTLLGESLREILLHRTEIPLSSRAEMLLYMSSRAQLVQQIIQPALDQGSTVLSDRFLLANIVYQSSLGDIQPDEIWQVGQVATGGLLPDLTVVLDLDPAVAFQRLSGQRDRLESRGIEYMTRVRDGFLSQAGRFDDRLLMVDASQAVEEVHRRIVQACQVRLAQNKSVSAPAHVEKKSDETM